MKRPPAARERHRGPYTEGGIPSMQSQPTGPVAVAVRSDSHPPRARRSHRDGRFRADLALLPDLALEAAKAARGEELARARLEAATAAGEPLLTATGRPRSIVTLPEYRQGRAPGNKGKRYPAEILTPAEITALLDALPRGGSGIRSRALI